MTTPSVVRRFRNQLPLLALVFLLGATVSGAGPALSALPSGASVTTAATWGTTVTVARPSTTAAGDVLVASVTAHLSSAATITAPAGWTLIRRDSSVSGYEALTQALYYKVAGASEPASYGWSLSASSSEAGAILDFKNVDAAKPIDSHGGAFTPNTRNLVAPSVTTTVPGDVVVGFFGMTYNKSLLPPSGMTEEYETAYRSQTSPLDAEGAAFVMSSAGPSGSRYASSLGHPTSTIGQLVALRPVTSAPAPPPPPPPPPAPPPPPPPPPPSYPPTGYSVHHYWVGIFATDAFDYSTSTRYDDFIAHAPDSWATQGARFKAAQPNGRAFVYQDFGVAGDGVSTVVSKTDAQNHGWLATHNGATITNPWGGTNLVVDLGKPGVQAAYIAALQSKLAAHPWDAVFADDVNDWQNLWAKGQSIDGYTSYTDYLNRALLPLLQAVKAQISKPIVPNIGDWANQRALDKAADALDGGNQEFFLMWGNGQSLAPSAIENEYASMQHELAAGKPYYGIVHRTDVQGLQYAFCGAAIMGGDHPNLTRIANQVNYGSDAPAWDTSLETQLGAPTNAVQHVTGSTTWSRSFAGGKTLTIDTGAQACSGLVR